MIRSGYKEKRNIEEDMRDKSGEYWTTIYGLPNPYGKDFYEYIYNKDYLWLSVDDREAMKSLDQLYERYLEYVGHGTVAETPSLVEEHPLWLLGLKFLADWFN